ncbi:MAG: type III-B CRISPR module RAMP protein Cmr4 [Actinobacteria bacterium]|nr:type III-B CRISPR module RAMP protein Cmr4 [Actinomycetota bacterium]
MKLEKFTYLIMTLDPVHVGTGGYRLGRVDNAIIREPGTNLPKIPGTSLHGSIQSAAALRYGDLKLAGQNKEGKPEDNPIIYTFGSGEQGGSSSSGVASIHDARILLFPVASQSGPVWITTASVFNNAGFSETERSSEGDKDKGSFEVKAPSQMEGVRLASNLEHTDDNFAIGWLMLRAESKDESFKAPSERGWDNQEELKEALSRTVIVHESLFSELVNSNLEVRTSVAINPETGAAAGALFTYEAIPRTTFMTFDVVIDDYREADFPNSNGKDWQPKDSFEVVSCGLKLLEYLGVGGMNTRGFGRIKVIGDPLEQVVVLEKAGGAAK